MTRHDPLLRLRHMVNHAQEAVDLARCRSRSDLDEDRMLNLSLAKLVEIIGGAAAGVPKEIQTRYPDIPWRQVVGIRNRLIHGYDTVNFDILWHIVKEDLGPLIMQLEAMIEREAQQTKRPDT